jgi:hypothetical protein
MRLSDDTIQKFIEAWEMLDPRASGMIQVDLLEQLLIELTLEEIKITKKHENDDDKGKNILFNLHKNSKLLIYVKMKRGLEKNNPKMK